MWVILSGFSLSGIYRTTSTPIQTHKQLPHTGTGIYVYDIDPSEDLQDTIIPYLNSSDIGDNIIWVSIQICEFVYVANAN